VGDVNGENVDFPIWMIASLDKAAKHLGVTRQSIIKVWLAERLERINRDDEYLNADNRWGGWHFASISFIW